MEQLYRDLALQSEEHHDAYMRMADTIKNSTKKEEADTTELDFITYELEIATEGFNKGAITEDHLDAIIGDHVECLEKWVNATYL